MVQAPKAVKGVFFFLGLVAIQRKGLWRFDMNILQRISESDKEQVPSIPSKLDVSVSAVYSFKFSHWHNLTTFIWVLFWKGGFLLYLDSCFFDWAYQFNPWLVQTPTFFKHVFLCEAINITSAQVLYVILAPFWMMKLDRWGCLRPMLSLTACTASSAARAPNSNFAKCPSRPFGNSFKSNLHPVAMRFDAAEMTDASSDLWNAYYLMHNWASKSSKLDMFIIRGFVDLTVCQRRMAWGHRFRRQLEVRCDCRISGPRWLS